MLLVHLSCASNASKFTEKKADMEVGRRGRESRKKRIVERGSDRLALITGRLHSLQDDHHHPSSPSIHHSHACSSPALMFSKKDDGFKSECEQDFDYGRNVVQNGTKNEPHSHKCETKAEATLGAQAEGLKDDKLRVSSVSTNVPDASQGKDRISKPNGSGNTFITPKDISSCILATENTRVFCSVLIALLVILSYVKLPKRIVKSRSVISLEPLYVLLLTDFSIVSGLLVIEKRKGSKWAMEELRGPQDDIQNWEGAVTLLELGLVLHQALHAIFIDWCFYVVIVVCGFCVM